MPPRRGWISFWWAILQICRAYGAGKIKTKFCSHTKNKQQVNPGINMKTIRLIARSLLLLALLSTLNYPLSTTHAQGTAFIYQGRLNDGTNPATGIYDLQFTIYDAATGGAAHGVLTNAATGITNGLFTVPLDFSAVFNGANYWLDGSA